MGLLDLPLEVIDEIISLTLPVGIESFALSCKAINARAGPQIKRHNAYKRRWRHALIVGNPQVSALRAIAEIADDSLAAEYVESLHLRVPNTVMAAHGGGANIQQPHAHMQKVAALVAASAIDQQLRIDPSEWWEAIENESTSEPMSPTEYSYEDSLFTTVALIDHLPNLNTLQLSPAWSDFQPLQDAHQEQTQKLGAILDALVENANRYPDSNIPLSRLHTILPFMSEGYEERAGLQTLLPFLELTGLKELFLISCLAVDDNYTGIPFRWRSPDAVSSLTRMELAYCCMDADGLSQLVSHTPQLQVFRYSHQTKWHGCQHDWNPGTFVEVLARYCGKTLKDLAITIDDLFGEIENGASSFLSLPHLVYLEVDVLIFCGPPVESGQRRGMAGSPPTGQKPWAPIDIPCIGSMLPDNVVEVQINTDFPEPDESALRALLKNIRTQRQERLKKLETVVIRQQDANSGQVLADESGVVLDVFDVEGAPRSMMPNWKRQFEQRVGGIHFT
ncbi:hypothetical protein BU24DRAFT_357775 [Aaosphaeria arxii CBS 175.79]|uniref:F-box domain-containing protein n=1 Tax=Aaosphaeria arxii CBS 175.79 TaxID=1450172 RepID=A0A6A5XA13_9PLEO|nr:uncharacterized protein BU24DRAFT_357775 [Aaosphaeria arxii CBS 175.79]KAF2009607.1 hypothetical protein BU24DRAFT_357775 [Aaosphaeria arxii CBS 175.79]